MMPLDEASFTDTNILIYAATPSASQHSASRAIPESGQLLCASAQVFAEFYAVVTNPRRVTVPFSPAEARAFLTAVLPRFEVLPIPGVVVPIWAELAERQGVIGHNIFDLQLVATVLASHVRRIYTFNRKDFEPLLDLIDVLTPA